MKVQCQCGTKYAFDVTPEMARDPVRFICPGCGLDLSAPINDLVRQELGLSGVVIEPNVGGGISRDQVWRSVRLFAQEVAPRLR